jgi:cell division protein FtsL
MKYISIVLIIGIFVISYVWQNIEMMKMKSDYKKLIKTEKELNAINDKLKLELERLRSFNRIEASADKNNLKKLGPEDIIIIKTDRSEIKKDEDK